jgi:hypothetical protein
MYSYSSGCYQVRNKRKLKRAPSSFRVLQLALSNKSMNDFPAEVVLHVVFEIVGEAGDGLQFVERRPEVVPDCATSKSAKPVRSP